MRKKDTVCKIQTKNSKISAFQCEKKKEEKNIEEKGDFCLASGLTGF